MGLDQYVYILNQDEHTGWERDEDNEYDDNAYRQEDFYWRKHNRLEGFMAELYYSKGNPPTDEEGWSTFNCTPLELTADDIEKLAEAIENKNLPETQGFFFGSDSYSEYEEWGYKEKDLEFIEAARKAIKNGKRVWYVSSW